MTEQLRFRTDGTLRVLQLADIQDGPNVCKDSIELIEKAVEASDPDVVIFTGDQIRGYDPAFAHSYQHRRGYSLGSHRSLGMRLEEWYTRFLDRIHETNSFGVADIGEHNNAVNTARAQVLESLSAFLAPITSRNIAFAVTYGNHDFQCGVPLVEQEELYRSFAGCLNPKVTSTSQQSAAGQQSDESHQSSESLSLHSALPISGGEPGTCAIPVMDVNQQKIAMVLTLVNSGDYTDSDDAVQGYGGPSAHAIQWLGQVQHQIQAFVSEQEGGDQSGARHSDTGQVVPAVVFQHIPAQEYYNCLRAVPWYTPYAVEGTGAFKGNCYVLDESKTRVGSTLQEGPCASAVNSGEVEAMRRAGGYFALFCGHDHKNTFIGHDEGIDLGYTPACGFRSYGPSIGDHALRLLVFHQDKPQEYETELYTYRQLIDHAPRHRSPLRVFISEYAFQGGMYLRNRIRRMPVIAAITAVVTGIAGVAMSANIVKMLRSSH